MSAIRLYWWRNTAEPNFGDELSPVIVEHVSGRSVAWASMDNCDLFAIGSILDKAIGRRWRRMMHRPFSRPIVWGSGAFGKPHLYRNHNFIVRAVRGPKTRDAIGAGSVPMGDPALFLHEMIEPTPKRYRWGIVPHMVDRDDPAIKAMLNDTPGTTVIDPVNPDPLAVARQIVQCDFIVSSSLHGLIAADALGVPNVWVKLGDRLIGGNWKFEDYFASVERDTAPASADVRLQDLEEIARSASADIIERRIADLRQAFTDMPS